MHQVNRRRQELLIQSHAAIYAEIGVHRGDSVVEACTVLPAGATVFLFDYHEAVQLVGARVASEFPNKHFIIKEYGNSTKTHDNYNWALMELIAQNPEGKLFDYVYLDGAHELTTDACATFLVDRLLRVGGHLEFDDYEWSFATSATVNPRVHPETAVKFPEEQIRTPHIKLVVDHLMKGNNPAYEEVEPNRTFQKIK